MKADKEPPLDDAASVGSQSTDLFSFDSSYHQDVPSMLPDVVCAPFACLSVSLLLLRNEKFVLLTKSNVFLFTTIILLFLDGRQL